MTLSLYAAQTTDTEPITLEEARTQLRQPPTDENALIALLITAARERAESATNRQLLTATWDLKLDAFPSCDVIVMPKPPLLTVTSITYVDSTGTSQTLAASAYTVRVYVGPHAAHGTVELAYGQVWPVTRDQGDAVTIRYTAGYGTKASDVPAGIRQAMLLDIGTMYEHREDIVVGSTATALPMGCQRAYRAYRAWPLAA